MLGCHSRKSSATEVVKRIPTRMSWLKKLKHCSNRLQINFAVAIRLIRFIYCNKNQNWPFLTSQKVLYICIPNSGFPTGRLRRLLQNNYLILSTKNHSWTIVAYVSSHVIVYLSLMLVYITNMKIAIGFVALTSAEKCEVLITGKRCKKLNSGMPGKYQSS